MHPQAAIGGAGLGLRRAHLGPLLDRVPETIDFMELAPENWLGAGGRLEATLESISTHVPLVSHGLLLNLGGPDPIDVEFVRRVKTFLDRYEVRYYGDHMTYCADGSYLYELLPMPYTESAARHMAARIRQVQDILGRQITVENASYYCTPGQEIGEADFINLVLDEADCLLLLDINNIYVNSVNHGYDAVEFLSLLPGERIAYAHIAGHEGAAPDLIIDTHGAPVIDPVWELLDRAYEHFGVFPTLLERDENIPPLEDVLAEVDQVHAAQARHGYPLNAESASGG